MENRDERLSAPLRRQKVHRETDDSYCCVRRKNLSKELALCCKCEEIRDRSFHHICPKNERGKKRRDNICILCRNCHNYIEALISVIRLNGYDVMYADKVENFWHKILSYFLKYVNINDYSRPRQLMQKIQLNIDDVLACPV